ncbi:transmembrane protein 81 [Polypterus senegalus]|uniref:transmembrane protein 81 n=1 Tax=Polypterus senegalus TaxID=55291 RepID=UPI001964F078|nr:transmembrane protein 81 [Polypterus senegalus]XP_039604534.1 transmembrane protein 81 [Polypterus senegalus]
MMVLLKVVSCWSVFECVFLGWHIAMLTHHCHTVYANSVTIPPDLPSVSAEVIVNSTECSHTCGLGLQVDVVCTIAMDGKHEKCEERNVECVINWVCGLTSFTATVGSRQVLDCVSNVINFFGKFKFIFTWRYARGIVTTDDAYFKRYETKTVEKLVLNPVKETDAGTYRCDVQSSSYKMVQRAYFAVKVLPPNMVYLDYDQWLIASREKEIKQSSPKSIFPWRRKVVKPTSEPDLNDLKLKLAIYSLCGTVAGAIFICLVLACVNRDLPDSKKNQK